MGVIVCTLESIDICEYFIYTKGDISLIMRTILILVLLVVLLTDQLIPCEAAKGGAKSAMNRRRKNPRGRSRPSSSSTGTEDDDDGPGPGIDGSSVDGNKPCIGICHYMRLMGIMTKDEFQKREERRQDRDRCI